MPNNIPVNYNKPELPIELLNNFATYLKPEVSEFYNSEEGKSFYDTWLKRHPEEKT